MAKREISHLDLKIKLTKEYLENGGLEKIEFPELLEALKEIKFDKYGKAIPETVNSMANAMMMAILGNHMEPPYFHSEHLSEYASTLQKENSFEQKNIDTIEQFDEVYEEYKSKTGIIFRGQREAKWRLYSKLQRQWLSEKLFEKEGSYEKFIEKLVEAGKADFDKPIKEILTANHIDTANSISILGYLQHHGCPTPLLDWTFKFQNALYFALDGMVQNSTTIEIQDYCSVYFLDEKHMEDGNMRSIIEDALSYYDEPMLKDAIAKIAKNEDEKKEMEEHFKGRKFFDRSKIIGSGLISHMTQIKNLISFPIMYFSDKDSDTEIIFSLNNNKNIKNQVGVFTWNFDSSKPMEMVCQEEFSVGKSKEESRNYFFCHCFNINKKLESHIRKRLEMDGITKEFIYPGSDLSTAYIYDKCRENH